MDLSENKCLVLFEKRSVLLDLSYKSLVRYNKLLCSVSWNWCWLQF